MIQVSGELTQKCRASEEAGKVAQDKRSDTHQIC